MTLPERREALLAIPAKARFDVGTYEDGSGPVAEVSYDTSSRNPTRIWVETSSDQWIAFDWQYADDLAEAIKQCAAALRARSQTPSGGGSCPPLANEPKPDA